MTQDPFAEFTGDDWPRFISRQSDGNTVSLAIVPHAGLTWFRGHFPGHPVLPGVVQIHWAAIWSQKLFDIKGDFAGINNLKFRRIITPDESVTVTLSHDVARDCVSFEFRGDDEPFSSGRILFTA